MDALFRPLVLLALLLALSPVHAELYKWVDANGKVHYSDKKPEDRKAKTKAKRLEVQTRRRDERQTSSGRNAIIRPADREPRKLLVTEAAYDWEKRPGKGKQRKIGRYASGTACTSRGPIRLPEVYLHHKSFFPSERAISETVSRVIDSLDYDADPVNRYRLIQQLKKTGGLSLHPEIVDLDLTACARSSYRSSRVPNPRDLPAGDFNRNRARITLRWKLKDDRDQRLVSEITTRGQYSNPKSGDNVARVITRAIEAATAELLSKPEFVRHLLVEEDGNAVAGTTDTGSLPEVEPIPRQADQSVYSLLLDTDLKAWKARSRGKPVGALYFGGKCAARRPVNLKELALIPDLKSLPEGKMLDTLYRTGRGLRYDLLPPAGDPALRLQRTGGLLLKMELVNFSFESCAPEQPASAKYKQVDKRSFRSLLRHRVRLGIKWSLRSGDGKQLLIQIKTTGAAGSLDEENDLHEQIIAATRQAARRLFAQPTFVAKLVRDKPAVKTLSSFSERRKQYRPVQPQPRDPGSEGRKILLVLDDRPWQGLPKGQPVGMLALGRGCSPLHSRIWPQDYNRYKPLYAEPIALNSAIARAVKTLDHPFVQTSPAERLRLKRKLGLPLLQAEIVGLTYDSCAPKLTPDQLAKNPLPHRFTRHRALVELRWRLYGRDEGKPLLETTSLGLADSWQIDSQGRRILTQAVEDATRRLFAQPRVLRLLQSPALPEQAADGEDGDKSPGFFSRLFSGFGNDDSPRAGKHVVQAQVGKVLADLQNLRYAMIEYMEVNGRWPTRFEEIRADRGSLLKNPAIDEISLQPDGGILVELPERMGRNRLLRYGPIGDDDGPGKLGRWSCRSNLPDGYRPQPCEAM